MLPSQQQQQQQQRRRRRRRYIPIISSSLFVVLFQVLFLLVVTAQRNNDVEDQVTALLSQMTLRDMIGQMIMDAENTFETPINIGAYLVGAADPPLPATQAGNTPSNWRARMNTLNEISKHPTLNIPVLFGTDAVHGHNIITGGTIFPHNIGLGATRNAALVQEMARITALEMDATALDLTFAPTLAVARTMTWGRTYESFSEDTSVVAALGAAYIQGMQRNNDGETTNKIATAKHWIGDGGTNGGVDTGDTQLDDDTLMQIHGQPYINAIAQNVGAIMVSFSSVNNETMHGNRKWITDVLKDDLGFQGFVLSDWEGYLRNEPLGDYPSQIHTAVNAGIDMLMCPYQGYVAMDSIQQGVTAGIIAQDRIEDAARRVLRVKLQHGIMDRPAVWDTTASNIPAIGTPEHRAVARQAVRESLVLLKNDNNALPLLPTARLLLAGKSANNIQNQCGGWTMSWQGDSNETRHAIVGGTTILEGFQNLGGSSSDNIQHSASGIAADASLHDVAIVVVGEFPYAETLGDNNNLVLDGYDLEAIANVRSAGIATTILVSVSGRPLIIPDDILDDFDAFVAAWLPGTEGDGVAEVFYGGDYDFTGKLPFSWPRSMDQVLDGFIGDNPDVLYLFGHGLDMASTSDGSGGGVVGTAPEVSPAASPVAAPIATTATPTAPPVADVTDAPTLPEEDPSEEPAAPDATQGAPPAATNPTAAPVALSDDAIPGRPFLLGSTSTSLKVGWREPTTTDEVFGYVVLVDGIRIGTVGAPPFDITGLKPATSYTFTVRALDAAGNQSKQSPPFVAGTTILIDDFADGDDTAFGDWGVWRLSFGGVQQDGNATMHLDVDGYNNTGIQLVYNVDSGSTGYANLFLDYSDGASIDLTAKNVVGLQFRVKGQEGTGMHVTIGTPLASPFVPIVYRSKELALTEDDWQMVTLMFGKDFAATDAANVDYTILEALKNTTALVFENDVPGQWGWFILDEVEFLTPQSLALGPPPEKEGTTGTGNNNTNGPGLLDSIEESELNSAGAISSRQCNSMVVSSFLAAAMAAVWAHIL